MNQTAFVERRAATWERLEALLERAGRRGLRALAPEEVAELGRAYRWTTSDLAYAQGRRFDPALTEYLNRLTARAHAYVYGGSAETGWGRVRTFYTQTFPQEFRRSFAYFAICTAITIVTAVVAYVVCRNHPADAYALLPQSMVPPEIKKSLHDSNFAHSFASSPEMATLIITNNIKVCFTAFAGGITLGLGTLYIIAFNGLMLGGLGALYQNAGFGTDFWITVAPHGFIELTAIQISGAAGLLLAAGIVYPGRLRRRDAIVANARRAGILIAGVASMLVVAGTIEGFFSPRRLPEDIRLAFGCVTAVALVLYFAGAGRRARSVPALLPADTGRSARS
jgi:uncharacterized membrane protein SpoIIM required for sporulation